MRLGAVPDQSHPEFEPGAPIRPGRALERSQPIVGFCAERPDPSGQVLSADSSHLALPGCPAAEIIGRGHDIFCPPGLVGSPDCVEFWSRLRPGALHSGTFRCVAKGGRPIRIGAPHNSARGSDGLPARIAEAAMDVTESHEASAGLPVDAKAEILSAAGQTFDASKCAAVSIGRT